MLEVTQEVALFVDFENIRRACLQAYDCEPAPFEMMKVAREYGRVIVATAYADFAEHPSTFRRSLEVAGITPRDIPRRETGSREASVAMVILMDFVDCLLDRPDVGVYVLMTGNSDFARVVARARHRFGKEVIVAGIAGTVDQDLINSADDLVPLVVEPAGRRVNSALPAGRPEPLPEGMSPTEAKLVKLIDHLQRNRPYMTFRFIHSYAVNPAGRLRLADTEAADLLDGFVENGLLIPFERRLDDGRMVVNVRLNYSHPASRLIVGPGS